MIPRFSTVMALSLVLGGATSVTAAAILPKRDDVVDQLPPVADDLNPSFYRIAPGISDFGRVGVVWQLS